MKLFKKNTIKKQNLGILKGGANDEGGTVMCEATIYWAGYGIGWRGDTEEKPDVVINRY